MVASHGGRAERPGDEAREVQGEFVWHAHEDADELFLVRSGELRIEFRDQPAVELGPGELVVVPRGVEHRPFADEEAEILLFEPAATTNTGDVESEYTQTDPVRLE